MRNATYLIHQVPGAIPDPAGDLSAHGHRYASAIAASLFSIFFIAMQQTAVRYNTAIERVRSTFFPRQFALI